MVKRLSEKEKEEITKFFIAGKTIYQLSNQFNCTQLTISRNLKKNIGQKKYDELNKLNKKNEKVQKDKDQNVDFLNKKNIIYDTNLRKSTKEVNQIDNNERDFAPLTSFTEIIPLDYEIENSPQKDLSSI